MVEKVGASSSEILRVQSQGSIATSQTVEKARLALEDADAPNLLSRLSQGFTRMSFSFSEGQAAKEARKAHLQEMKKQAHQKSTAFALAEELGITERHGGPSAGEQAHMAVLEAQRLANVGSFIKVGLGTPNFSPITKMSAEKRRRELEARAAKKAAQREMEEDLGPAPHLSDWFNAGLTWDEEGRLQGRRPYPPVYVLAPFSSPSVPLLLHENTGVVVWPVRFDLVPLYSWIEQANHYNTTNFAGHSNATTLYHYTSKAAFNRLVGPPEYVDPTETDVPPHEYAEEIWDRISDDLFRRRAEPIEDISEYSLPLVAQEPSKFPNRESVAGAVFRMSNARHHHMAVAYCIAVLVPTEKVLACGDMHAEHTAIVLAPGENMPDDSNLSADYGNTVQKKKKRFARWAVKLAVLKKQAADKSVCDWVQEMNLLHGIIDRDLVHENDYKEQQHKEMEQKSLDIVASKGGAKPKALNADDEEDRLERKLAELERQRELVQRKIRHAARAQGELATGGEVRFLETDTYRVRKLENKLERLEQEVQDAKAHLRAVRAELEITIDSGTTGMDQSEQQDEGEHVAGRRATTIRRRRKKDNDNTGFAEEVVNFVNEVGDEYSRLQGNVFREVFGGHKQGVEDLLEAKADPNAIDQASGWAPLHMAVSNGDIEIVLLLIKSKAYPTPRSADQGLVPMHLAVRKSSTAMLEVLLTHGARALRERSNDGSTPLMMCITSSPPSVKNKMIGLMLEAHADPNVERADKWCAMSYAVRNQMKTACKLLVLHGGKVLNDMPDQPQICVWQAAGKVPGLQDIMREKLNSRDLQALEKRFPGTIKGGRTRTATAADDGEDVNTARE